MEPIKDQNQEEKAAVITPKVTGKLVFQFEGGEPIEIQDVIEFKPMGLTLLSPPEKTNGFINNPEGTIFEFRDGDKVMKLYIKSI